MENHDQPENQQVIIYNNPAEKKKVKELPPGFRFFPYDVELLDNYLLPLVYGKNSPEGLRIPAVDLYCDAPQDLTAKYKKHCEKQWYFFTKRTRKYSGGNRPNRGAGMGFWKQTNVIKRVFKVHEDKTKVELGRKITLDYYDKSFSKAGERTNWKMNEYRVNDKLPDLPINYSSAGSSTELDEWCLCRIYLSARKGNKTDDVEATSEDEDEDVPDSEQVALQAQNEYTSGANFVQQNAEHTIAAAAQGYSVLVVAEADPNFIPQNTAPFFNNQHVEADPNFIPQNTIPLFSNQHVVAEADPNFILENTAPLFSNQHVVAEADPNFIPQNTAQLFSNQHVVAEADPNFILQNTAPLFMNQHVVAPQEFYGQNAGGLDTNSFQQSTTPLINDAFSNFSNPYYFENTIDGLMNWMSYENDYEVMDQEEIYPVADQQLLDNGSVQPIRSLPATGLPILPSYNFNQSSSSTPGDVTRGPEEGSLSSLVFGNGQCSSDGGSKNGGFDQAGN